VIIFIGEFLPQIGAYISAAIIVVIAFLARGWQVGLIAAIFCTFVNAGLEGQILAPRIIALSLQILEVEARGLIWYSHTPLG